jgi:hypothetical protein
VDIIFSKYSEGQSCTGKRKYNSIIEASDVGRNQIYLSDFKLKLFIYECVFCKKFHLTTNKTDLEV